MIRNRRELESVAAQWTARAKNDLRNQMIAFIEQNGTNEGELADALAISVDEIDQILNGNGEISLSTFAKILIATDNVIEIKPAAVMKQHGFQPQRGRMPMPPMGEGRMARRPMGGGFPMPTPQDGYPLPPMGEGFPMPPMGEEMPPFGSMPRFGGMPMGKKTKKSQPRLANGQFAPKNAKPCGVKRVNLSELDLDELGRNELCDIITQNHWESEIDLNGSRRGDLINFLNYKIQEPQQVVSSVPQEETENERIGRMLAEEVARNPHLKEMVKKYL